MIRDFSVKPASYGQALSGLGQTLADYRQERDARDAQKKKERATGSNCLQCANE